MGFAYSLYQFGDFRLNPKGRTLFGPGGRVTITAKAFDALVFLVEHAGELVERPTLNRMLWPKTIVEDNNLNQAIAALRRALGDGYIVTIPGRGYQFVAKVAVISDPEASSAHAGVHADVETVLSTMRGARPAEELPGALPTIAEQALEQDPAERYQNTGDIVVDDPRVPTLIETIPKRAYGLLAPVVKEISSATADAGVAGSSSAAGAPASLERRAASPRRYARVAAIALGLVAILVTGVALLRTPSPAPAAATAAGAPVSAPAQPTLPRLRFTPLSFERGGQGMPVWSPDGRAIAYSARQRVTEPLQLYVRYLDSPVATRLTERDDAPARWTSTGQILFGSAGPPAGLWSISPVGGTPELVHPNFERGIASFHAFTISRDGSAVAGLFRDDDGTIALAISSPPGAPPRRYEPPPFTSRGFMNAPFIEFSPDNKQLLLMWNPGSGEEVWLIPYPADSAHPPRRVLENLPVFGGTPTFSWMPDNRHIVVSTTDDDSPRQLYVADTQSGAFRLLSSGTSPQLSPMVSPDGKKLVFVEGDDDFDIVALDLTTAAVTPLIATDRGEDMPAWAMREAALVYVTNRNGGPEIWLHEPGRTDRPVVTARNFPTATQFFMGPALSPDGKRVIFARTERGTTALGLWMSAVDGGSPQRLMNIPGGPTPGSWSPDGNSYVYMARVEGRMNLLKVKTTGQAEPEVVATDLVGPRQFESIRTVPAWSPSGEWILHENRGTKLISADGKTVRDLDIGAALCAFARDPDTKLLYCIRAEPGGSSTVFAVDYDGENQRPIGTIPIEYAPRSLLFPALRLTPTPDGKSVTYSTRTTAANLWLIDGLDTVPLP